MKTSPNIPRWTARTLLVLLLVHACGLSGCLSRPPLDKQTFAFNAPLVSGRHLSAKNRALGVRRLQIDPPFDGRSLVYRTAEFSYVRDPYAEFLGSPTEGLVSSIRTSLRGTGAFSDVLEDGSALKANLLVEINVNQLYGDFRQPEHPAAILNVRFAFIDAPDGIPGKAILQREYSRSLPLGARTPDALMEGWNQALARVLTDVLGDLERLDHAGSSSPSTTAHRPSSPAITGAPLNEGVGSPPEAQ